MKQGRFAIILILVTSVLIFSSCSRAMKSAIDGEENDLEETVETSGSEEPDLVDPSNNSDKNKQPTSTPIDDTKDTLNDTIQPIQMGEVGMAPIPIFYLNKAAVNSRILELIAEPWVWGTAVFERGIDQYNYVFVIHSRFPESIAGSASMGSNFDDIIDALGSPGYKEDQLLVYRTSDFYLAFYGAGKAEFVSFMNAPIKDYDDDFLYKLIEELNSDDFTSLEASIEKVDPDMDFFHEKGSDDLTSYYAHSLYGIDVSDVEEPIIDIMNNYEGNLYIQASGDIRFSQGFNDLDAIVIMLRDTLYRFDEIAHLFSQQGVLSPDGLLKAVYHPDNYMIVTNLDSSIADRNIFQSSTGEFFWLGSRYLLYIDDFGKFPETLDIDATLLWGESLLEQVGLDTSDSYKVAKVDEQVITLEDTNSGSNLDIGYAFNSSGEISFSVK